MTQKILQNKLFTEEECKIIIGYSKVYSDFIVTPLSSLKENTRNVYYSTEEKSHQDVVGWTKSYNVWDIPVHSDTSWMYDRIYKWFSNETGLNLTRKIEPRFCKETGLNLNGKIDAHKLHQYRVGDKFDKHIDNVGFPDRIWNLGIQLNDSYLGGDYIVYTDSNPTYLSKETGTVIAYTSDVLHEVTEIIEGERWSMVIKVHNWELILKNKITLM
jgi:hypothetical protein